MNHLRPFAAAAIALAALAGCFTPRPVPAIPRYAIAPEPAPARAAATPHTLGIRPFAVARPYALQMAYLGGDQRFGYREEEWAEHPGATVTRALADALIASGRFADLGNAADMVRPGFILTGELRKFHEDRTQAPPVAVVELRLELRPARQPGAVWAQTLHAAAPVTGDGGQSAAAVAAATTQALSQVIESAAAAIAAAPLEAPEPAPAE